MGHVGVAAGVLLVMMVPAVAWGLVPQAGTQAGVLRVPFKDPPYCAQCHDFAEAQAPFRGWSGSMMANATRDPLLWATLAVAEQDVPEVGDVCLRCHSPAGWLRGHVTGGSGAKSKPQTRGEGLDESDFEGVTCHLCHRMTLGPEGHVITQNAQVFVADDDIRRGPYEYPDIGWAPPHHAEQSDLFTSASLCGQCHNVTNPLVFLRDSMTGENSGILFPIERTFEEWKQSAFADPENGQTCQGCHMPVSHGVKACNKKAREHDVARHEFSGGNTWIPVVLAGEHPELGRAEAYAEARERALTMLQQRSAIVSVSVDEPPQAGMPYSFSVRVENTTGHKLPTGYAEGRRMWLSVEARVAGEVVFASGVYDEQTAELLMDPQIKIYEAQHGMYGVGPTFHFVKNDVIVKDNRIPPRGFVPNRETEPAGASFAVLPGGALAHWDDTKYVADLPVNAWGELVVTATLWYQTSSREYVDFLRQENRSDGAGERLFSLWQRYGMSPPVPMVTATATAAIAPCVPMEESCNRLDDDCDGYIDEEACVDANGEVIGDGGGGGGGDDVEQRGCAAEQRAPGGLTSELVVEALALLGIVMRRSGRRQGKTRKTTGRR